MLKSVQTLTRGFFRRIGGYSLTTSPTTIYNRHGKYGFRRTEYRLCRISFVDENLMKHYNPLNRTSMSRFRKQPEDDVRTSIKCAQFLIIISQRN